jgi:lipopolysaccharide/colanic/teichoic acid biosynthesis glycosyltransferase
MSERARAFEPRGLTTASVDGVGDETTDWDSALPPWAGTARWRVARLAKRLLDVVLALLGLVVLSPLLVVVATLIKLDSPGPVLHRMAWVGLRGRRFGGYKLRTMIRDAERHRERLEQFNEMTGPAFKMSNDPRVTRFGRFLRGTSIDELPQLWSVLRGDMSLVGPRPPQPHEYAQFEPYQRLRLAVTPGLTCLWQVCGRSTIRDFAEWVRLDLEYIRTWSLWLDFKILMRTIPVVLTGRGAS